MTLVWWDHFSFEHGQARQWEIGPVKLAVQRLKQEWWIDYERDHSFDELIHEATISSTHAQINEDDYPKRERFAFKQTNPKLTLLPALADRAVIIRPVNSLSVLPGESVTLYAGILLWACLAVGDPPQTIKEIPLLLPAETWFGPSTIEGELGYASVTNARLNVENVPARLHRATTQVHIQNQAKSVLVVDRLSLPVPYLSLFQAKNGRLWTQRMRMIRQRDNTIAQLSIDHAPPPEVYQAQLISKPRRIPEKNMFVRAFGTLFGATN